MSANPVGQIGLANWTPDGFIGHDVQDYWKIFAASGAAKSPLLWGTRTHLTEMFGSAATWIKTEPRRFNFRYRSSVHFLEVFRNIMARC